MATDTQEVINEIRTELARLTQRLDELEKELAERQTEIVEEVAEPVAEPAPEPVAAAEPLDLAIDIDTLDKKPLPDLKGYQWMVDIPGSEVGNMISGISLNDRVLFINTLFNEEPGLFQSTINTLNGMEGISEAAFWLMDRFPEWNFNSEVVYRFMMAARRKLK